MDLNFSELDNIDTINTGAETNNYWEQQSKPPAAPQKRKKVSFDDILSNMNLVVNKTGVLQRMVPMNNQNDESSQHQQQYSQHQQQYSQHQQQYSQQHQQQYPQQQQQYYQEYTEQPPNRVNVKKQEPLDPSLKHSYIYNKYFKDYQDATPQAPEVKTPKTKEEYFRMIHEERLRRIQEAHRISQIKSRKLMFTANNTYQENIRTSANKLHKMSFN
jgi:transcriptional regulator of acetoin/glycerol metabolism